MITEPTLKYCEKPIRDLFRYIAYQKLKTKQNWEVITLEGNPTEYFTSENGNSEATKVKGDNNLQIVIIHHVVIHFSA